MNSAKKNDLKRCMFLKPRYYLFYSSVQRFLVAKLLTKCPSVRPSIHPAVCLFIRFWENMIFPAPIQHRCLNFLVNIPLTNEPLFYNNLFTITRNPYFCNSRERYLFGISAILKCKNNYIWYIISLLFCSNNILSAFSVAVRPFIFPFQYLDNQFHD